MRSRDPVGKEDRSEPRLTLQREWRGKVSRKGPSWNFPPRLPPPWGTWADGVDETREISIRESRSSAVGMGRGRRPVLGTHVGLGPFDPKGWCTVLPGFLEGSTGRPRIWRRDRDTEGGSNPQPKRIVRMECRRPRDATSWIDAFPPPEIRPRTREPNAQS